MAHSNKYERALVISDGGLASLIATAIVGEDAARSGAGDQPGAVWSVPAQPAFARALAGPCERAAARHASFYGLGTLGPADLGPGDADAPGAVLGRLESLLLIRAAFLAAGCGCARVVWPVVAPSLGEQPDVDEAARLIDRAVLAGRLASLDIESGSGPGVRIETPLVDLSDDQIAELGADLGVPVQTCWWWGGAVAGLPGAEGEAARWCGLLGAGETTAARG